MIAIARDPSGASGYAWFEPPATVQINLMPGAAADIANELIAWGEGMAAEASPAPSDSDRVVWLHTFDHDETSIAAAARHGFAQADKWFAIMSRELGGVPHATFAGADVVVKPLSGSADVAARVALTASLSADAYDPTHRGSTREVDRARMDAYRRLRAAPGFRTDLDLLAEIDGVPAGYAIAWYDPASESGEIEPLATAPAFRRRGVATALIVAAMARLRLLDARCVQVPVSSGNDAVRAVLERLDFRTTGRYLFFRRRLRP